MSSAGVNYCSVPQTQLKQVTLSSRTTNNMEKKNIKVRDLKPSKDAKGGGARGNTAGTNNHGLEGARGNTGGRNTAGTNSKQHLHHGSAGHT
jgi:hypothetical protein